MVYDEELSLTSPFPRERHRQLGIAEPPRRKRLAKRGDQENHLFPAIQTAIHSAELTKGQSTLLGILLHVTYSSQKEIVMGDRFSGSIITAVIAAAIASAGISLSVTRTSAQAPAVSGAALKTPWGEPDLQGIWTDEFDTPLQRSAKYANQEFFTEAQRADLDKARSAILTRFATEREINGAYNAATFFSTKRTGARTSKIVDPPNGRFPPLTPEAQKAAAAEREFRLALLQWTETCKNKRAACAGGTYDPRRSPRFADAPPRYNTARM